MKSWHRINEPTDQESELIGNSHARCKRLFEALDAVSKSGRTDFDMRVGIGEIQRKTGPEPAIVLEFNGETHGFTVSEAAEIADVIKYAINKFPGDAWIDALSDIVLAISYGSDEATKDFERRHKNASSD